MCRHIRAALLFLGLSVLELRIPDPEHKENRSPKTFQSTSLPFGRHSDSMAVAATASCAMARSTGTGAVSAAAAAAAIARAAPRSSPALAAEGLARHAKRAIKEGVDSVEWWTDIASKTALLLPTMTSSQVTQMLSSLASADALVVGGRSGRRNSTASSSSASSVIDLNLFAAMCHALHVHLKISEQEVRPKVDDLQPKADETRRKSERGPTACGPYSLSATDVKKIFLAFGRLRMVDGELLAKLEDQLLAGPLGEFSARDAIQVLRSYRDMAVPLREVVHPGADETESIHPPRLAVLQELCFILREDCGELSPPELSLAMEAMSALRICDDECCAEILRETAGRLRECSTADLLRLIESWSVIYDLQHRAEGDDSVIMFAAESLSEAPPDTTVSGNVSSRGKRDCSHSAAESCASLLGKTKREKPKVGPESSEGVGRSSSSGSNKDPEWTRTKNVAKPRKKGIKGRQDVVDEAQKQHSQKVAFNLRDGDKCTFGGAAAAPRRAEEAGATVLNSGSCGDFAPEDEENEDRCNGNYDAPCSAGRRDRSSPTSAAGSPSASKVPASTLCSAPSTSSRPLHTSAISNHIAKTGLGQLNFNDQTRFLRALQKFGEFDVLLFHKQLVPRLSQHLHRAWLYIDFLHCAKLLAALARIPAHGPGSVELCRDVVDVLASLDHQKRTVKGLCCVFVGLHGLRRVLGTDALEHCLLVGGSDPRRKGARFDSSCVRSGLRTDEREAEDSGCGSHAVRAGEDGRTTGGVFGVDEDERETTKTTRGTSAGTLTTGGLLYLTGELLKPAPESELELLDTILRQYFERAKPVFAHRDRDNEIDNTDAIVGAAKRARFFLEHYLERVDG